MTQNILFVSHKPKQCGVYEFGNNLYKAISGSSKFRFIKIEVESLKELEKSIDANKPAAIIYNYHPSVMPWLCTSLSGNVHVNHIAGIRIPQVGIIHEVTQEIADTATSYRNKIIFGSAFKKLNSLFDFYIAADPTLLLKNPYVFKTGRLVPTYKNHSIAPAIPTIGSFGFATPNKGFEELVSQVQKEFDVATIKLNMPSAFYGDANGSNAKKIAIACQAIINKPGIKLEINHDYLDENSLLEFLGSNSINAFFYQDKTGRGISSTVDYALAVQRPLALTNCPMFRHVLEKLPQNNVEESGLSSILSYGSKDLESLASGWDQKNMAWEFERIIGSVLSQTRRNPAGGIRRTLTNKYRSVLTLPEKSFSWLRNTDSVTEDNLIKNKDLSYSEINNTRGYNRILDDEARDIYKPSIDKLIELAPRTMAKKIARANVQQGFVFDTVYRFLKEYDRPRILCVGSYEDTASMGLRKLGYDIEEIDPMVNYYLQEYREKPSTKPNSFDIIFSTSVIEHDPDDKSFMESVEYLLAPGGLAVVTMDFKDGWKQGDPKPDVDARFYTKYDLETRLPSYTPSCKLVDIPDWDCPDPDFVYLDKYIYSFASYVIRKDKK